MEKIIEYHIDTDKIIDEIKKLDNIDINDNYDLYNFLIEHVIDSEDCELKNEKYKSIETILFAEFIKCIKNGTVNEEINDQLKDACDDSVEECSITAQVYFESLDP